MLERENLPLVAGKFEANIKWLGTTSETTESGFDVEMVGAQLIFHNQNQHTSGPIAKERTALVFNEDDPATWGTYLLDNGMPQEVFDTLTSIWANPEDAFRALVGVLYETEKHQIQLGLVAPPEPEA